MDFLEPLVTTRLVHELPTQVAQLHPCGQTYANCVWVPRFLLLFCVEKKPWICCASTSELIMISDTPFIFTRSVLHECRAHWCELCDFFKYECSHILRHCFVSSVNMCDSVMRN